jgi:hypothetical protein
MRLSKVLAGLVCLAVVLTTGGCFRITADEFYSLPQPSKEYLKLQEQINAVLATGAEYSPPTSGPNRQSVQLKDLDSDGKNEAVAFFRVTEDKPLRIYIMKQEGAAYRIADVIEGDGTAIESIRFYDLDGDGASELIVGWQASAALLHMTIYSIKGGQHVSLADDDYTEITVNDLNNDRQPDVIALRLPSTELPGQADVFSVTKDGEVVNNTVRLSKGLESISQVQSGTLMDGTPALFVESSSGGSVITDVITSRNGSFYNITASLSSGVSEDTLRGYAVYCTDINNDGIMEVPFPRLLEATSDTKYYVIDWFAYNKYGMRSRVFTTYHDFSDGWYLILPDTWKDTFMVRREDSVPGERTLIFSYPTGRDTAPIDFLKIYTLSGDNKDDRAKLPERFELLVHGDTIYAGEILQEGTSNKVTLEQIKNGFRPLYSDWTIGVIS